MNIYHDEYSLLASRISINNLHKETLESFSETIEKIYNNNKLINDEIYEIIMENREIIDKNIDHDRDY
jgi:hypothetical protein